MAGQQPARATVAVGIDHRTDLDRAATQGLSRRGGSRYP